MLKRLVVLSLFGAGLWSAAAVAQPTDVETEPQPPATGTPQPAPQTRPSQVEDVITVAPGTLPQGESTQLPPAESSPLPPVESMTGPVEAPPGAPNVPPPPPSSPPVVVGVVLGGLDKIAARTAKFEADINQQVFYNTLIITAHVCKTRPPEEPPESTAFLDILERKPDGTTQKIFSGWMFASSPALNALEHPVYDVWVISCKTVPPETAAPAPPNS